MGRGDSHGVGGRAQGLPLSRGTANRSLGFELPAGTYTVSQFGWEVKGLLADAYPDVWVAGEVQRVRSAARGQLYFELVEKGRGDSVKAKLDCVLWADERQTVEAAFREAGVELVEGVVLRCCGKPDFWPGGGRFQFTVGRVDPVFSLGALEQRRRETLRALEAEGLLERNKRLALGPVPLNIGLVTSEGSAAHADFLDTLVKSGLGFRVYLVHSAVQGMAAEAEVGRAFELLGAFVRGGERLDAIALIRGGGSRADLATFDSRHVARAVARSPVPVVCGVGHQIDQSIADVVAHTSCKTPTEAAEFLVARVERAARQVEEARRRLASPGRMLLQARVSAYREVERGLVRAAERALAGAGTSVDHVGRTLRSRATISVVRAGDRLRSIVERLPGPSRRSLAVRMGECRRLEARVHPAAERLLRRALERMEAHRRLCDQLSPERTLARGFSLTRKADGRLVRSIADVNVGTELRTSVHGGTIGSSVYALTEQPRQRELLGEKDRT